MSDSNQTTIPGAENVGGSSNWENFKCRSKKEEGSTGRGQPMFIHLNKSFVETGMEFNSLQGEVVGIGCSKWKARDAKETDPYSYSFYLFLQPEVEGAKMLRCEFTFSMYTRGILSKLLHLVKEGTFLAGGHPYIVLKTYPAVPPDIKYPGITMRDAAGENIPWGLTMEETPDPTVITDPDTGAVVKRKYDKVDKFYAEKIALDIYPAMGPENPGRMRNLGGNESEYMSRLKKKWGLTDGHQNDVPAATDNYPATSEKEDPVPATAEAEDDDLPF